MNRLFSMLILMPVVTAGSFASEAEAREQIRAVGSSTVFPFITVAAEQFGQGGKFKTPIVESTGTGGGFKLFCEGVGASHPDISNASRPMTDAEKETCKKNGVGSITELPIGYDGIVIAASKKATPFNLTRQDIFLALARQVPKDGKLVNNPNTTWKQVNPSLPNEPILVYGPPPTSGTRDAFVELALEPVCKEMPEYKAAYADEKERGKACKTIREDGKYVEAGEDDNLIIQKLKADSHALGVFGYSFLAENKAAVQGMKVDNVAPAYSAISDGSYKLSRTLFIYVKNDHLGNIPGLQEFVQETTSDAAMGPTGYMANKGLIALHDKQRETSRMAGAALGKNGMGVAR
jgi:phosphate transport system substrate-binding protein